MQKKKGISLIVLVITIIVMIVLAGAIILSLNNAGIIQKANEAVKDTDEATVKELAQMAWSEAYADGIRTVEGETGLEARVKKSLTNNGLNVNDYGIVVTTKGVDIVKGWLKNGFKVVKGNQVLEIGDIVNYNSGVEGYTGGWKVLGADDKGNILIMSAADVTTNFSLYEGEINLTTAQSTWLSGGVNKLNNECAKYGKGEYAIGARSITVEDIDKVTGYNKIIYGKGYIYEYENEVAYIYNGTTKPTYTGKNEVTGDLTTEHTNGFYWYDEEGFHNVTADELKTVANKEKEIAKVISNNYSYKGVERLSETSDVYQMIFGTSENYNRYWLASPSIESQEFFAYFSMRHVLAGHVSANVLWDSKGEIDNALRGVRAVVTLQANIPMERLVQ